MANAFATIDTRARFATDFNDQSEGADEVVFEIPENFAELPDEEFATLLSAAAETFTRLYGDGTGLSAEVVDQLTELSEGLTALNAEKDSRAEAAAKREETARELAAQVGLLSADTTTDEDGAPAEDSADESEDEKDTGDDTEDENAAETVTAGGAPAKRGPFRVNVSRLNAQKVPAKNAKPTMKDVVFAAGEGTGYPMGAGIDWDDLTKIIDKRLSGYNHTQFANAARKGQVLRQQFALATIKKPSRPELTVTSNDPSHIQEVVARAVDESALPGGSLVAAGGWCAPSETLYDLVELESRDGLFSLPEITVGRGGISRTLGPTFSDIYADTNDWDYSEEQDLAGDYDGAGGGTKPCMTIDCPEFEEFRMRVAGLCIQAGLLQARGYPEMIARVTRGVLTAHEHKMSGRRINAIETGSTPVTYGTLPLGAVAPVLTAIEQQVEHFRYTHRLTRTTTIEAVLPYWVRPALRTDLALVSGVSPADRFNVTDAQIDAWFRSRGINPQYVYNWQDLGGAAGAFKAWPASVKILMYPAGTWVGASRDVLTLDTLYDSTLLGTNDYTALWTEEGWMVVKMSHDSRVVTVPLVYDGQTSLPVLVGGTGA